MTFSGYHIWPQRKDKTVLKPGVVWITVIDVAANNTWLVVRGARYPKPASGSRTETKWTPPCQGRSTGRSLGHNSYGPL